MIILYILGSAFVVFTDPDFEAYKWIVFWNSLFTAFIDTIAEGLSSQILKKSHQLVYLKKTILNE
jgi:hypothetical protein